MNSETIKAICEAGYKLTQWGCKASYVRGSIVLRIEDLTVLVDHDVFLRFECEADLVRFLQIAGDCQETGNPRKSWKLKGNCKTAQAVECDGLRWCSKTHQYFAGGFSRIRHDSYSRKFCFVINQEMFKVYDEATAVTFAALLSKGIATYHA